MAILPNSMSTDRGFPRNLSVHRVLDAAADEQRGGTNRLVPDLAEKWEVAADLEDESDSSSAAASPSTTECR